MLRSARCLLLALATIVSAAPAQVADSVSATRIRHTIRVLAHDSLRGRATPSRGLDAAARWVAAQFRQLGLVPLGDSGSFLQRYDVYDTRLVPESSSVELLGAGPARYRLGQQVDWLKVSDPVRRPIVGDAYLLTGLPDSTDPFGGMDVRGGVVIHLAQMLEQDRTEAPDWLFAAAARAGVAAWILVVDRPDPEWRWLLGSIAEPRTVVPGTPGVWPFPVFEMRDDMMGAYLAERGITQAGIRPVPAVTPRFGRLSGITVRIALRERVLAHRRAPNVLALLPGSDTAAARGHVLVGAHLDGLGIGRPIGRDSIYNGADDNASGVAAVLAAARALRAGPGPARNVVFALFSGTERGEWGSGYYLEHPAAPLAGATAFVNVEAIGRNLPDSLAVIGGDHPALAPAVRQARAAGGTFGLTVVDDPWPKRNLVAIADHGRFRVRGVPVLYLFNGQHAELHRPGDERSRIRVDQVVRAARFLTLLLRGLAAPAAPTP